MCYYDKEVNDIHNSKEETKMKMLYYGRNFFGERNFVEEEGLDSRNNLKKAFSYLKKNDNCALHFRNIAFCWDSLEDFNGGIMKVNTTISICEINREKMSFEKAKKLAYSLLNS